MAIPRPSTPCVCIYGALYVNIGNTGGYRHHQRSACAVVCTPNPCHKQQLKDAFFPLLLKIGSIRRGMRDGDDNCELSITYHPGANYFCDAIKQPDANVQDIQNGDRELINAWLHCFGCMNEICIDVDGLLENYEKDIPQANHSKILKLLKNNSTKAESKQKYRTRIWECFRRQPKVINSNVKS